MRPLLILLAASLVALAFSLSSAGRSPDAGAAASLGPSRAFANPVLRTHCGHPRGLRLDRFEDGSAQLLCGGRLLVRVHVPG